VVAFLAVSADTLAARARWRYRGEHRPSFAEFPDDGQRSVWDFPRPPRIEPVARHVRVEADGIMFASSRRAVRVCETAGAPTYYVPPQDLCVPLASSGQTSICEWKGLAETLDHGDLTAVGWRYVQCFEEYAALHGWVSFYPAVVCCFLSDERARAQGGGYYGGWVTDDLSGPIKGAPGTEDW
jgi:uncharacterized protein (DUF427 family)|tara:strand:- start:277 stop:825 length:549 start_codon:yes stop_codon:yes gene_type:complete